VVHLHAVLCREAQSTTLTPASLPLQQIEHARGFRRVAPQPLASVGPVAIVGAFLAVDPSLRSGQALDVPDNRRVFVGGRGARRVAEGVSRALALPVTLEAPAGGFAPVAILRPLVQFG